MLGIRHAVEAGGSRCGICNGAEWRTLRAAELRGQATSLLTYQVTKLLTDLFRLKALDVLVLLRLMPLRSNLELGHLLLEHLVGIEG